MKKYGFFLLVCAVFLGYGSVVSVPLDVEYWEARGDAALAQKNNAGALIAWLRAERIAGLGGRIRIVQKRCLLPISAQKNYIRVLSLELVKTILLTFPLIFLQVLMLLSLGFAAFCMRNKGISWVVKDNFVYCFALCLLVGALCIRKEVDENVPGVLLKPMVNLTSGPSESFPFVTSLQGPDEISVAGVANGHVKIARNACCGWVSADCVEIV